MYVVTCIAMRHLVGSGSSFWKQCGPPRGPSRDPARRNHKGPGNPQGPPSDPQQGSKGPQGTLMGPQGGPEGSQRSLATQKKSPRRPQGTQSNPPGTTPRDPCRNPRDPKDPPWDHNWSLKEAPVDPPNRKTKSWSKASI